MAKLACVALLVVCLAAVASPGHARAAPVPGENALCTDFRVEVLNILGLIDISFDSSDEGWVWASRSFGGPVYRSVSGFVTKSKIARNDSAANHNSHDQGTDIEVDAAYEGLLSTANGPNTEGTDNLDANDGADDLRDPEEIEMEWEIGTFPNEKGQSVLQRYLPQWAWPSVGDRVWTNGHWVFDCGHGKDVGRFVAHPGEVPPISFDHVTLHRTEIHPPRAIASMRSQAATLPGTGTTPVPVTATDLYIHGRAGYSVQQLFCGMAMTIEGYPIDHNPFTPGDFDGCPDNTTPIAEDYEFDICLPPRPSPFARLASSIQAGPGNTIGGVAQQVQLTEVRPAPAGCANDSEGAASAGIFDQTVALHARVPLAGSGASPLEVYARRIVSGWVHPPAEPLPHLQMRLFRVNLHDSKEGDTDSFGFGSDDAELTFFWAGVDRAPTEWVRLADTAPVASNGNSVMNDYDPSMFGNSFVSLAADFDFYLPRGRSVGIHANGYDQDCYDDYMGEHHFNPFTPYIVCGIPNAGGNNDALDDLEAQLDPTTLGIDPGLHLGNCPGFAGAVSFTCNLTTALKCRVPIIGCDDLPEGLRPDYELDFTVNRIPTGLEDIADLAAEKTCTFAGEVLLPGVPVTCTISVANNGPGLPDGVTVTDSFTGAAALGAPSVTLAGQPVGASCSSSTAGFSCSWGTIPVGETATITVQLTPASAGNIVNSASVATGSTDPATANNTDSESLRVFLPVTIDVRPGATPNTVNLSANGVVAVAVLTTPSFNAATIRVSSVCFGSAVDPSRRDCTESHGGGHLEDVDRDRDIDLLLHYDVSDIGLELTSTRACLIGELGSGIGVYGCDTVAPR